MPYIIQKRRKKFKDALTSVKTNLGGLSSPGDLNYLFTKITRMYMDAKGVNYQVFNDILGALEGAKLELYRKQIAAYEDIKLKENGDV